MRLGRLMLAFTLAGSTVHLAAQPPPAPPQVPGTFRTSIALVPLDVRVLDDKGRPVTDLRQDEFVVFEERVPQRIEHFSHHTLSAESNVREPELAMRQPPDRVLDPQNHRVFLLVLGRGRLQYPARGIDAAIAFVREKLLPQDQVAVMAYNRATDFTVDRAAIVQVLERFRERHELLEADLAHRLSGLAGVYGSRAIPESMQSRIDQVFEGPGTPGFRRLPAGRIVDLENIEEETRYAFTPADPLNRHSFDTFVGQNVKTLHDLGNVYAGIEYLRYIDGEKHLVYLSEFGLFVPGVENDVSLADVASDARVVIDTIMTGGVFGEAPGRRTLSEQAWRHNFAAMSVSNVARLTGGRSSLFSYAEHAFSRIDDTTRSYYLLGYYPRNPDHDGRFRRISVKVTRPGVTVLVRHGYFARPQLVPFDRRQFLTYSRIIAAGGYPPELTDIKLDAKARVIAASGGREVVLDVNIDPARVAFADSEGHHLATLDIAVFCGDRRQSTVCEKWDKAELRLTPESLDKARAGGIHYSVRIPVKGDPKYVKVVVYDYGADVLGSAVTRIR